MTRIHVRILNRIAVSTYFLIPFYRLTVFSCYVYRCRLFLFIIAGLHFLYIVFFLDITAYIPCFIVLKKSITNTSMFALLSVRFLLSMARWKYWTYSGSCETCVLLWHMLKPGFRVLSIGVSIAHRIPGCLWKSSQPISCFIKLKLSELVDVSMAPNPGYMKLSLLELLTPFPLMCL